MRLGRSRSRGAATSGRRPGSFDNGDLSRNRMHATRAVLSGAIAVALAMCPFSVATEAQPLIPTTGGLVFRLGRVVCLSFTTDKPLHEARLVIDSKEVRKVSWGQGQGVGGGIKVAVINPVPHEQLLPSPQHRLHSSLGTVTAEVADSSSLQQDPFRPFP